MHNRPFQKSQIWEISNHCCFGVEGKETYLGKTHFLTLVSIGPRTKNQLCASWISKISLSFDFVTELYPKWSRKSHNDDQHFAPYHTSIQFWAAEHCLIEETCGHMDKPFFVFPEEIYYAYKHICVVICFGRVDTGRTSRRQTPEQCDLQLEEAW